MNKPLPQTIEDVEQMGLTWYILFSDKKKWFLLFCLYRPCRRSKTSNRVKVNGVADSDEDISLKEQLKENDTF
jgi:hypothetical protein